MIRSFFPAIRGAGIFLHLVFLYCFILPLKLHAQENLQYYSSNDGIPGKSVYCINQDKSGFIWIGTDAGACRFDGKTFDRFSIKNGLSDDEIIRINIDSKNRVWFFTVNGKINYLQNGVIYNSGNTPWLKLIESSNSYIGFYEDDSSNIWIGSMAGDIYKITSDGKVISITVPIKDVVQGYVYFAKNQKGQVVYNCSKYIVNAHTGNIERDISKYRLSVSKSQIPGLIILASDSGYVSYYNGEFKTLVQGHKVEESLLYLTSIDADTLLFCMNKDYSSIAFDRYGNADTIKMPYPVNQRFKDAEGNIWFTTINNGIFMVPVQKIKSSSVTLKEGMEDDGVLSLWPYSDSVIFVSFVKGGFNIIDRKNHIYKRILINNDPSVRIVSFQKASNDSIWLATDAGLHLLIYKSSDDVHLVNYATEINGRIIPNVSVKSHSILGGTVILAGTYRIYQLQPSSRVTLPYMPEILREQRYYYVFTDKQNNLWISSNEGVLKLTGSKLNKLVQLNNGISSRVKCIASFNDYIILGTYSSGIYFLKNDSIVARLNDENGLESNSINAIAADTAVIYVSTDKGIARIRVENELDFTINNINSSNGLNVNYVNIVALTDSFVYAGTTGGLTIFNRPLIVEPTSAPRVFFKSISLEDSIFNYTEKICLNYNFHSLIIQFAAPVFINTDQIRYRFRLRENNDWSITREGRINLVGLQPGSHVFEVQAKKGETEWGQSAFLKVEVLPPFWQTWWFRIPAILLIVVLVYYGVAIYIRSRLRRQLAEFREQQALEAERKRISSDMHDDLGADLTNIVLLSRIAKQNAKESPEQAFNNIESAASDVILKMNEIIWALNPVNDKIDNLIAYLRVFTHRLCEINSLKLIFNDGAVDDGINIKASVRRNLFLCIKECLHNIVKHAHADTVTVNIHYDKGTSVLHIIINDNGIGMQPGKPASPLGGNGLKNMYKRMQDIRGKVEFHKGKPAGTEIKFSCKVA